MADDIATLRTMYERFNARDIDGVLATMDDGVEWANGLDGGYVKGKDAVREYWTRQWAQISPRVEPLSFDPRGGGAVVVQVQQDLFDLSGQPLEVAGGLHSQIVKHVYRFDTGRVVRFDIGNEA